MLFPLIGVRLHGWLDDVVVLLYLVGAWALRLGGAGLAVAVAGAAAHFLLTRLTDYPHGAVKLIPFRVHAFIELGEGIGVGVAAALLGSQPAPVRGFLALMALSQVGAFTLSDYGPAI